MKIFQLHFLFTFTLCAVLIGASVVFQMQPSQARPVSDISDESPLKEKLRSAASQHEIVTVLIENGYFHEATDAFRELLSFGFSGPQEKLLTQSEWKIVEKLRNLGQYDIAHQIVTTSIEELEQLENTHTLLMLRAKIYQEQGRLAEALDTLQQAKALGSSQ